MSDSTYNHPEYYDIAFSFRDIPAEVDLFEEQFRRFAKIDVRCVLELACGNSPHMTELLKRGYDYRGLDLNPAMLDYSRAKARRLGQTVDLTAQDMNDFTITPPVDFAYIMLGSLAAPTTAALIRHFDCVAAAVKPGGLYLLDWCIDTGTGAGAQSWEMERNGIHVKTTARWETVSLIEQLVRETITLEVDDHGTQRQLTSSCVRRVVYPQEFRLLIDAHPDWEFVGWWNCWNMDEPLESFTGKITRPVVTVRRI